MAAMTELPPGFKVDSEPDGLPVGFVVDSGEEISRQAAKAQGGEGLQEGFVVDLPAGDELPAGFTVDGGPAGDGPTTISGSAEAVGGAPGNFNIQRPTSNIQHPTPNETLGGLAALREEAMTPEERAATGMVTLAPSPLGTVEEMLAANRAGTVADFEGAAADRSARYRAWEDATREYATFAESSPLMDSPAHAELRGRVKAAWAGLSPEDQRAIAVQNQAIGFAEALPGFIVPGPQLAGIGSRVVRQGVEGGLKMAQAGAASGAVEDGFAGAARGAVEGFVTGLGLGAAGKAPLATLVGFTKLGMAQGLDGDEALGNAFAMWATGAALGAGGGGRDVSRKGAKAQGAEIAEQTAGAGGENKLDRAFYTDLVRRARAGDAGARARIAELVGAGSAESTSNIERPTSNIQPEVAGPVTMPPAVRNKGEVIGRGAQEGQEGLPVGPQEVSRKAAKPQDGTDLGALAALRGPSNPVASVPPTGTSQASEPAGVGPDGGTAAAVAREPAKDGKGERPYAGIRMTPAKIRRASFKELKDAARQNTWGYGVTVWDGARSRTAAELRSQLLEHRAKYMADEGAAERPEMSWEHRQKLSRAAKQRMSGTVRADDDDRSVAWDRMLTERSEAGTLLHPGESVRIPGDDREWQVVNATTGDDLDLAQNRLSYSVTDGEEFRIVTESEIEQEALDRPVDEVLAEFDEALFGGNPSERGSQAEVAPGGGVPGPAGEVRAGGEGAGPEGAGRAAVGGGTAAAGAGPEGLTLEAQTPAQVQAERDADALRSKQDAEIARRTAPIRGGAGDLTADAFGEGQTPLFNERRDVPSTGPGPGADLEADAAGRGKRGAVLLPERQALGRALRAIRAQFSTTQGMPRSVHTAFVRMHDALEATRYGRRQAEESIRRMVHGLEAVAPRDRIMADVGEVQTGGMTPADFGARYNLPPTSPEVRALEEMKRSIFDAAQEIAKWEGLSPESQERIRQNIHYVTRRYLRMVLGAEYRPPAQAVADAVTEVENGLLAAVSKLEGQATAVRGRRGQVDVVQWLNTGDPAFLVGVSRTRAAAAQRLRRNWLELRDLIDTMALNGNAVTAQVNADAVKGAADGIVGYYLGRDVQGMGRHGGIDIGNLSRRFLESTAFRKLYGEITDPAARYGATVEAQGALLAQMAFMNRVLAEGEGTVWAVRPDPARGLTERLGEPSNGADRRRYGDLVGRYVTPEFLSMVAGDQNRGPIARVLIAAYSAPMAVTRLAHLLNPRTAMRNWYTSWIGNGLASGDMLNPTYFKRWAEAHAIAAKHVWGSVQRAAGKQPGPAGQDALAELQRAAELGYYTAGQNSFTMDMQIAMGGVGAKARGAGRKIARAYAMIDFMSKYASYWSCIDSGMTPEQARVHVAEMYQNKYRIPRIASKVSATGLADYLPYTADSVRFTGNHLRNAVDRLRHGDPRAMIGLALSRAMLWALALGAGDMITRGFSALHRAIRGNKSQGDGTLGPQDQDAMRDFVAKYDRNMPLLSWYERDPVKGRVVYYAVAGGQSAFPVDDWFVGALQSREHGQSFLSALAHNSAQQVDLGMYPSMVLTGLVGQDFVGNRTATEKGIVQAVFGREDPRRAQILKDALEYMGTEFSGVSALKALARLTKMEAEQRAGVEQVGPFRETKTEADILASAVRMVRVYRVERPDMNRALARRVKEYAEALGTAHGMISTDLKKNLVRGGSTADDKNAAALAAEARPRYINRMAEFVRSARKVMPEWYGDADLQMLLTADEAGLNGLDAMEVIRRSKTEPGKAGPVPAYMPAPRIRPYQFMRD